MNRFFIEKSGIAGDRAWITDPDDIKHIAKVLRLMPGERIEISDGQEYEYEARIIACDRDAIDLEIIEKHRFEREPELLVDLFQGIPKQGKMEQIIQKAVELGASAIIPVFMARSIATDKGNSGHKTDRWQKIADEAVKQCKRGLIPLVDRPIRFPEVLSRFGNYDLVIFPYENERETSIKQVLQSLNAKPKTMAIIIGPEGGFSDAEADQMTEAGAIAATLGKTILRTETAGSAAIAMVMYELEL
jgi:16S rRNA (uracil1498-N3)-methyltransferase